jgi:hypothetical protein
MPEGRLRLIARVENTLADGGLRFLAKILL